MEVVLRKTRVVETGGRAGFALGLGLPTRLRSSQETDQGDSPKNGKRVHSEDFWVDIFLANLCCIFSFLSDDHAIWCH